MGARFVPAPQLRGNLCLPIQLYTGLIVGIAGHYQMQVPLAKVIEQQADPLENPAEALAVAGITVVG